MSLNAALSAIPAIPDPAELMAGSIGEEDNETCGTETGQVLEDAGLNTAMEEVYACQPTMDGKTLTVDYPSCDATADAIAACSSAGGMSYTIDVACSETSGSGGPFESINYSGMPGCAGTSCPISDFNTMAKEPLESAIEEAIGEQLPGTWSCTATASFSNPSDEALLSVE